MRCCRPGHKRQDRCTEGCTGSQHSDLLLRSRRPVRVIRGSYEPYDRNRPLPREPALLVAVQDRGICRRGVGRHTAISTKERGGITSPMVSSSLPITA